MDGAMTKTVLIILAAVVALIVIVVLTGMRYLRADDDISEPLPAARSTRSSARGRGGDDYDSLPGRRASSAEYDREPRDRRASRDSRDGLDKAPGHDDDFGGRPDGREPRDRRDRG